MSVFRQYPPVHTAVVPAAAVGQLLVDGPGNRWDLRHRQTHRCLKAAVRFPVSEFSETKCLLKYYSTTNLVSVVDVVMIDIVVIFVIVVVVEFAVRAFMTNRVYRGHPPGG